MLLCIWVTLTAKLACVPYGAGLASLKCWLIPGFGSPPQNEKWQVLSAKMSHELLGLSPHEIPNCCRSCMFAKALDVFPHASSPWKRKLLKPSFCKSTGPEKRTLVLTVAGLTA